MFIFGTICALVGADYCNIVKKSASELLSIKNLELPDYPVIFVGPNDRNKELKELSEKSYLLDHFGESRVQLSSSNTFSQGRYFMTLKEYIDQLSVHIGNDGIKPSNETMYLFGNNNNEPFSTMKFSYIPPECEYCDTAGATTVGIGGKHTGVAFHFHGPGFSEVIIGRKRWFLFPESIADPPGHSPNISVAEWVDNTLPTLESWRTAFDEVSPNGEQTRVETRLFDCVIHPGDMLYFPTGWMHATLNLDDYNVFVSQFLDLQLVGRRKE